MGQSEPARRSQAQERDVTNGLANRLNAVAKELKAIKKLLILGLVASGVQAKDVAKY
jgi:hypothetical protein